jgi:membrane associated rhomboid family serine protease
MTDITLMVLIVCFIIQSVIELFTGSLLVKELLSLSHNGLKNGFIWQLVTYGFLHDGPLHLIFNLLGIHFIGRSLESMVGQKLFLTSIVISLFLGGLMWLSFNPKTVNLIGFSSSVLGVVTLYCLIKPEDKINLLLFFILPVSIKPKFILYGLIAIEAYGFLFVELKLGSPIAHSAHLGGIITGYLIYFLEIKKSFLSDLLTKLPRFTMQVSTNSKGSKSPKFATKQKNKYTVKFDSHQSIQQEVDRILDKINSDGFGALNQREKSILEKAKNFLKK